VTNKSSELLIVTGLSGAGKSHITSVLEDEGWFVIDNLPPKLILPIINLSEKTNPENYVKIAVVVDVRAREMFNDLSYVLISLEKSKVNFRIIFVDADDEELVKRYEKVRRPHPLQNSSTILDGITKERELLLELRKKSDIYLNTTNKSIHDTSRKLRDLIGDFSRRVFQINIMSFGFKYGLPLDADMVFDLRFLPNPFWVEELRELTGKNENVRDYVFQTPEATEFIENLYKTLQITFDGFVHENKSYTTIAFGCTGGRHRSVAVAEKFYRLLKEHGHSVSIMHRDVSKND
jgi:UPF0042 nucleotide-binding protein